MLTQFRLNLGALAIALALAPAVPARAAPKFSPQFLDARVKNEMVGDRVYTAKSALESYSRDNNGHYPNNNDWISDIASNLDQHQLPRAPWGNVVQHESLGIEGLKLVTAATLAKASTKLPVGVHLGAGHMPIGGDFDQHTFGALLYDHDPGSDTYVIYAIGREVNVTTGRIGNQAVVIFAGTNKG